MKYLSVFVLGIVTGAIGLQVALHYHVVYAEDGMHFVPKISSKLGESYVDIREFDLADWEEHTSLAAAIVRDDKAYLLKDAANTSLRNTLDSAINVLSGSLTRDTTSR